LQGLQSGQFGLARMEKMAHIKPILCVFGTLFYSSGYTAPEMHHQQANIIQTARAGACWPVCVADLVGASSLAAVKTSPKNVLGPVPEVDVMAKRPQGLLNVGTLSARMAMAVLRSCALDI
jgi:hypothetical protein